MRAATKLALDKSRRIVSINAFGAVRPTPIFMRATECKLFSMNVGLPDAKTIFTERQQYQETSMSIQLCRYVTLT